MRTHSPKFVQVPYNTDVSDIANCTLVKVFRKGKKLLAIEYSLQWFEPDGHKYTGYVDYVQTEPYDATELFAEERFGSTVSVGLEDGVEWNESWGKLEKGTDM